MLPPVTQTTSLDRWSPNTPVIQIASKPLWLIFLSGMPALISFQIMGCSQFRGASAPDGNQADRLMAAYPDLASGRFAVIADFEQLEHNQLFTVVSHSGRATCMPNSPDGAPGTGSRCLKVTFADPLDALVVSNQNGKTWSLRRDWRDFHLLVGSIYCPVAAADLEVAITGGPKSHSSKVYARIKLEQGWNVLRLDLSEAATRVPLDDVREMRFSLPLVEELTTLAFDDLILADNQENLFGEPDDVNEGLYIQKRGRRWHIGAAGRFEIGFANAQIVHWYDLRTDPSRLNNLLGRCVLGPTPVVLPPSGNPNSSTPPDFSSLGGTVIAHQEVTEASSARIVVVCTLWFTDGGDDPKLQGPYQRWSYTILPTGQIYVQLTCTTSVDAWAPENIGLVVSRADNGQLLPFAHRTAQIEDLPALRHLAYGGAASAQPDGPGFAFAVHDGRTAPIMDLIPQPELRQFNLVASGGHIDGDEETWYCLLNLWARDSIDETSAGAMAVDYCDPKVLEIGVGELVTDSLGDENGDGYNERFGTSVLQPAGDLVRFWVGASGEVRFFPMFTIQGIDGRQAWVYVDNVILEGSARDTQGNLLFQLPGLVRSKTLVEVVLRKNP